MRSLVVILVLLAGEASAQDRVSIVVGGLASMGADTSIQPTAQIRVSTPLTTWGELEIHDEEGRRVTIKGESGPKMHVQLDLAALQGTELSLTNPATFRSAEFAIGISQKIHNSVRIDPYIEAGFTTKLQGQVADKTANYVGLGVRFSHENGWIVLTGNADQRLDNFWRQSLSVKGALKIASTRGVNSYILGRAILGAENSSVLIGIALGR